MVVRELTMEIGIHILKLCCLKHKFEREKRCLVNTCKYREGRENR